MHHLNSKTQIKNIGQLDTYNMYEYDDNIMGLCKDAQKKNMRKDESMTHSECDCSCSNPVKSLSETLQRVRNSNITDHNRILIHETNDVST